jgi:hypothetical protein
VAVKEFTTVYDEIKAIDIAVKNTEALLNQYKAPYTPGRLPEWKGN